MESTSGDSDLRASTTAAAVSRLATRPLDTNVESYPIARKVVSPLLTSVGGRLGEEATRLAFSLNFKINVQVDLP